MDTSLHTDRQDLKARVRWLMVFRTLFALVLLLSTATVCLGGGMEQSPVPCHYLIGLAVFLLIISTVYGFTFNRWGATSSFAFSQITVDTLVVTFILYITGGFASIFTFLYLLVIIAVSMLLHRTGSMIVAAMCSLQYGLMIDLEYYGLLVPLGNNPDLASAHDWQHILYRMVVMMAACFAVAFLSGILAAQARRARRELAAMEDHVRRVERMAVIGELAAGMAHEIKNPLASLSGSIQLLRDNTAPDSANMRLMQIVLRETDRLSKLVTDFLLFARPSRSGEAVIRLDRILMDTITLFREDALCRDRIAIAARISGATWVKMNADHLHQILFNLFKNAAEAIEEEGEITVSLSRSRTGKAVVEIADTGCGISETNKTLIFDPFFTTKSSGTGLGLSITHRIVELYGGMVNVESRPGKGSTFALRLDTVEDPDP